MNARPDAEPARELKFLYEGTECCEYNPLYGDYWKARALAAEWDAARYKWLLGKAEAWADDAVARAEAAERERDDLRDALSNISLKLVDMIAKLVKP